MVQQVRSSKRLPHSRARLIQTRLVKIQVAAPRAPSRQDLELHRRTRLSGNVRSVPVASLGEILGFQVPAHSFAGSSRGLRSG